jgi:hypothetical protein
MVSRLFLAIGGAHAGEDRAIFGGGVGRGCGIGPASLVC